MSWGETVQLKQHHNIYTTALKINSVCCSHAFLTPYFAQICSNSSKRQYSEAAATFGGDPWQNWNQARPPPPVPRKHFPLRSPPTSSASGWQSSKKHAASLWSPFPHCPRSIIAGAMEAHCLHPLTVSMVEPHNGAGGLKRVSGARGPRHHKSGAVQSWSLRCARLMVL